MEEQCANGGADGHLNGRSGGGDDLEGGSQQSVISRFNQLSDEIQLQIDELEEILKEVG